MESRVWRKSGEPQAQGPNVPSSPGSQAYLGQPIFISEVAPQRGPLSLPLRELRIPLHPAGAPGAESSQGLREWAGSAREGPRGLCASLPGALTSSCLTRLWLCAPTWRVLGLSLCCLSPHHRGPFSAPATGLSRQERQPVSLILQTLIRVPRSLQLRLSFPFLTDCVVWGKVFGTDLGLRPGCIATFGTPLTSLFCNS